MNKKILKERMRKMKNQKGITLVALIITIVVLLILAIVAIGAVQDSNIIGHAQNAAGGYNQAKTNEIGYLTGYEETINKYVPGGNKGQTPPVTPPSQVGTQYYVLSGADINIYEMKFEENTVNITVYGINEGELLGSQNLGSFEIEEVSEGEVTINVGSNLISTPISAPYKLINVGMNTYLKDDKYYVPENANYYCIATLDPDFDTSILSEN